MLAVVNMFDQKAKDLWSMLEKHADDEMEMEIKYQLSIPEINTTRVVADLPTNLFGTAVPVSVGYSPEKNAHIVTGDVKAKCTEKNFHLFRHCLHEATIGFQCDLTSLHVKIGDCYEVELVEVQL